MDLLLLAAGDVVLKPRVLLMFWMFGFSPDGSALVTASGQVLPSISPCGGSFSFFYSVSTS